MTKNGFGAQYKQCRDGTFLDFYSDYHPGLYGDMAITAKPKTVDPQEQPHSTQKGLVTVQKCPQIYF